MRLFVYTIDMSQVSSVASSNQLSEAQRRLCSTDTQSPKLIGARYMETSEEEEEPDFVGGGEMQSD